MLILGFIALSLLGIAFLVYAPVWVTIGVVIVVVWRALVDN